MTAGETLAAAGEPVVVEIAALDRRLRHLEAERQALTVQRQVWKVAEERPANLEHLPLGGGAALGAVLQRTSGWRRWR